MTFEMSKTKTNKEYTKEVTDVNKKDRIDSYVNFGVSFITVS